MTSQGLSHSDCPLCCLLNQQKRAQATSSSPDPGLPPLCVSRSQPYTHTHTHHSNPPVWLSGCLCCVCQCHNTWVMLSCGGINNFNLISAWENQKLSRTSEHEVKKEGRVLFLIREVLRQLKTVVTWSFEVRFQTSFPHYGTHPPLSMAV